MPHLAGVYETILYATDLAAAGRFYADVLGLKAIRQSAASLDGFRLPDGGVLLLFNPRESIKPGRGVPSHGGMGPGHAAFRVGNAPGELDRWRERLRSTHVEIEQEITWDSGARSIYFRDPAGNSVELVEGEIWPR